MIITYIRARIKASYSHFFNKVCKYRITIYYLPINDITFNRVNKNVIIPVINHLQKSTLNLIKNSTFVAYKTRDFLMVLFKIV